MPRRPHIFTALDPAEVSRDLEASGTRDPDVLEGHRHRWSAAVRAPAWAGAACLALSGVLLFVDGVRWLAVIPFAAGCWLRWRAAANATIVQQAIAAVSVGGRGQGGRSRSA